MKWLVPLIAAFVAGLAAGLTISGGHAHARPHLTPAAWSSMPCAADVADSFVRYTCPIER